ncbi:MAG: VirB3 family type IV secretion system protein [Gammaproteobacteria bacterium]|nr:VirB3 family type IV secretion system protein [Gammaproteobacteria bacterium]
MKSDPLFKGLTRPALLFGMPFQFALTGVFLSIAIGVISGYLIFLPVGLGLTWLIGTDLGSRDKDLINIVLVKISKTERGVFSGHSSYKPD